MSGLIDSACPALMKKGPRVVRASRNSAARDAWVAGEEREPATAAPTREGRTGRRVPPIWRMRVRQVSGRGPNTAAKYSGLNVSGSGGRSRPAGRRVMDSMVEASSSLRERDRRASRSDLSFSLKRSVLMVGISSRREERRGR